MKLKIVTCVLIVIFSQSCSFTRPMLYWWPNISDHKIFHHTEMTPGNKRFQFTEGDEDEYGSYTVNMRTGYETDTTILLDEYLRATKTTAFLVIRNDSILFEKYYNGYTRDSISKNFSISKSITSLLAGIAVDEGYIENVHDPVTKYVPELKKKNPKFERLTIEHLLNMRAGFKFNEDNLIPLSRATNLYYGSNHLRLLKRAKFKHEPGEAYEYQSLVTSLLGVVVERATERNLSEYLQEKIWKPLGMENRATWDIDSKRHHSNKAHTGVNATAIDLAKIGRLYLNNGSWNGKQIISAGWIAKSATCHTNGEGYQYQWWALPIRLVSSNKNGISHFTDSLSTQKFLTEKFPDSKYYTISKIEGDQERWGVNMYHPNLYFAEGILDQLMFVNPTKNMIVIRLGEDDKKKYKQIIYSLIDESL